MSFKLHPKLKDVHASIVVEIMGVLDSLFRHQHDDVGMQVMLTEHQRGRIKQSAENAAIAVIRSYNDVAGDARHARRKLAQRRARKSATQRPK